jgi:GntR family transcriptional regulator
MSADRTGESVRGPELQAEHPYLRLKESIIAGVAEGRYVPHTRLPSQRRLCEAYGVSHMTVRRAINELIREGVIYARQGSGLFVAEPKAEAELGPLIGFTEDMRLRGMTASSRVLEKRIVAASTILASALALRVGQPLVFLRRLRLADGEPMAVQNTFLPSLKFPGLCDHDLDTRSLYEILSGVYHVRLTRADSAAGAELASDEDAALLNLVQPAPLLVTEQITYTDDGRPIEFVRSVYRGDRYRLQYPQSRGPQETR